MSSVALDLRDLPDLAEQHTDEVGPDLDIPGADRVVRDAAPPTRPAPARIRCGVCGTALSTDEPASEDGAHGDPGWRVPVHAVGPDAADPFAVRPCPGAGSPADPGVDAVAPPEPVPAAPPARTLPADLHWRGQPFSHADGPGTRPLP